MATFDLSRLSSLLSLSYTWQISMRIVAEESISNIRTVRAFTREEAQLEKYSAQMDHYQTFAKRMGFSIGTFQGLANLGISSCFLFVMLYGGRLVAAGELNRGNLTSYLLHTFNLQNSLATLSILQGEIVKGLGAASRIFSELSIDEKPIFFPGSQMLCNPTERACPIVHGTIEFRNVSFTYPISETSGHRKPVLHNVSFHLEAGKRYALVGPSGSGKSTIVALLERFYEPSRGEITLDGISLDAVDAHWLRRQIALVSQEPNLFTGSIAENIALGAAHATRSDIELAAREANVDAFVSSNNQTNLSAGDPNVGDQQALDHDICSTSFSYDSNVGERGSRLSAGQRQRIAIARAILKNAKILILDEGTSALDAESEFLVQEALQRLMKGKTVLTIAHRLSTVQKADQILVLKDGRLVEIGSHEQLMKRSGVYAHLISKQLSTNQETTKVLTLHQS